MQGLFHPTYLKRVFFFIFMDLLLTSFSLYLSFLLRFSLNLPVVYIDIFFHSVIIFSTFRVVLFYILGLYRFQWRYFGHKDQIKLFYTIFLSTVAFYILSLLLSGSYFLGFPRSVLAVEFFISLFLLLSIRVSKRAYLSFFHQNVFSPATIIIGFNNNTEQLIRNLQHSTEYRPIAILVDNKALKYTSIHGVKIVTFESVDQEILDEASVAVITDSTDYQKNSQMYDMLKNNSIDNIKVLNSLFEDTFETRDITVEDLLARHPQDLDKEKIKTFIKDRTVLVTGAGGSIGSEICRQCELFGAKKLILLDNSEYNLYSIEQEIKSVESVAIMQSVVNRKSIEETFKLYKPDIVIHAAAYKHVPLVEANVYEGIVNNVIGTKNIIDLSIKYGVEKFVMISTDKAVRPTNVMGTTKRICELYAQNSNGQGTDIVAVRFGNVLGSSGSVIPKFKAQIAAGKNITVTHKDITRYFMLIPEACELVLQAGAIGTGGEIFILDMGEPIKIVDLANKMIELSGKSNIEIEFTGLRPGEKLYEELLIDDSDAKTDYESITVAEPTPYDLDKLNLDIKELLESEEILVKLKEIVPEFKHNKN